MLSDLGINQDEPDFENLHFSEKDMNGYWISPGAEPQMDIIVFYLAGNKFETPCTENTIILFNEILNNK